MNSLYKTIVDLCDACGITPYKMSKETGVSRSVITELKSGRTKSLSTPTLEKIANYFNVPVDYLLDLGEPSPRDIPPEPEISDSQLIFALWKDNPNNMTKDDLERVRSFAKYIEQEKGEKN